MVSIKLRNNSPLLQQKHKTIIKYLLYFLSILILIWIAKLVLVVEDIETRLKNGSVAADDVDLVAFVKERYIFTPSEEPSTDPAATVPGGLIDHLMKRNLINLNTPGYFIELGANDGLQFTSTLPLEQLGWKGLLIEPVPSAFSKLVGRSAVLSNATVSSTVFPKEEKFHFNPTIDVWGGTTFRFYKGTSEVKTVLTIPIYTLILAADCPKKVDLLTIDIEGSELKVLQSFPFDLVDIGMVVVETYNGKEDPASVRELLEGKGYRLVEKVQVPLKAHLVSMISTIITREDVHNEYQVFMK